MSPKPSRPLIRTATASGLLYGIWSEITGPFCIYNYEKGDFEGRLAERWKVENPTTWIFYLNKNYRFNDGTPVTAADVVHSMMNRVINDPQSKQKASVAGPIVKAEAVDNYTVKFTTDKPVAPLLNFVCSRLIVTSKSIFDKYGREAADKEHMIGAGPYRLKELILGQRLVIVKRPDHPEAKRNPRAPDEIVYRVMRETEQRVTALLNGEIQIAHFIPPHLRQRIEKSPNLKITTADSIEIMFLAMQPKPPFDKKEARQAVCHAINQRPDHQHPARRFRDPARRPSGPRPIRLRSESQAKAGLRSGKIQKALGPGRLCRRRRCRVANASGPIHVRQTAHGGDDSDVERGGVPRQIAHA